MCTSVNSYGAIEVKLYMYFSVYCIVIDVEFPESLEVEFIHTVRNS